MVLAERSEHRFVQLCTQCLLCGGSLQTARHRWQCLVQSHEVGTGPTVPTHVAESLCGAQGITHAKPVVGLCSPRAVVGGHHNTIPAARMGLAGPHNMGKDFIRQVLSESQRV